MNSHSTLSADKRAYGLLGCLLAVSLLTAFLTRGTYDSGDSIYHYQFARYAFAHPINFLESWSKPLVVQLMAGPAQLGLRGVMVWQCLLVALAAALAYNAARQLRLPWPWLTIVFCYTSADYFRIQFSGLTEPLFSLVLIAAVALALQNRAGWGALVISFLPFARSEGFLLVGVYGAFLLATAKWRLLPLLSLGFVLYGLAGLLVYHDFLWVFTRNAYPLHNLDYNYLRPNYDHFLLGLAHTIGWVQYALFWLGFGAMLWTLCRPKTQLQPRATYTEVLLVGGSIVVFLAAHTVFWVLGIFGSVGLLRVICCLVPLLSLVVLRGVWLLSLLGRTPAIQTRIRMALALAVVGFLFSGSRVAFRWQRDFGQASDQLLLDAAGNWSVRHYSQFGQIVYWHPYVAQATRVDPFGPQRSPGTDLFNRTWPLPAGTLVFWDEWYAVVEGHMPLEKLRADPDYRLRWYQAMPRNRRKPTADSVRIAIFEKIR